jgi:hypothetical protein
MFKVRREKTMKNMIILVFGLLFETVTATIPQNPYVTFSTRCRNHGLLTVRAEIVNRTNGLEEFPDEGLRLSATERNGTTVDLHFETNDAEIVLRKTIVQTIVQNGSPGVSPFCYLISSLLANQESDISILRALLTATDDGNFLLEGGTTARLHIKRREE